MNGQIRESDWKYWRKLSQVALERFCDETLKEAVRFSKGGETAHSRYRDLFQYLRRQDRKVADVFDDQRRSNAFIQIAIAVKERIILRDELEGFSEETKARILLMLGERDT